ncbi:hypothetical protein E1212_28015 [Jiangella ureilytica]|uniref:Uncharacterized protein n=1 Tax=Jiangella ureilytica TaxID=2530374 RepID=A0A4V2XVM3_9ACTN|nr:hypothetical protein [Jiangella ureilytica]TDC45935.1 hypothetical protein E1212_28015 [Jiangella ureilytica]
MMAPHGKLRYRAKCADCPWEGRQFIRYGMADGAAHDHADAHTHITFVVDQYDLRIAGSTIRPKEPRRA